MREGTRIFYILLAILFLTIITGLYAACYKRKVVISETINDNTPFDKAIFEKLNSDKEEWEIENPEKKEVIEDESYEEEEADEEAPASPAPVK